MAKKKTTPAAAPAAGVAVLSAVLLKQIIDDTTAQGFTYAPNDAALEALRATGVVETRPDIANPDGSGGIAARAVAGAPEKLAELEAAAAAAAAAAAPAPAPAAPFTPPFGAAPAAPAAAPAAPFTPPPAAPQAAGAPVSVDSPFKIVAGVPIPEARKFGKVAVYPFDSLQAGQAFFVPVSERLPNPAKSLASTVNSANQRCAVKNANNEVTGYTKHFILRNMPDGKDFGFPGVKGAAIWRDK